MCVGVCARALVCVCVCVCLAAQSFRLRVKKLHRVCVKRWFINASNRSASRQCHPRQRRQWLEASALRAFSYCPLCFRCTFFSVFSTSRSGVLSASGGASMVLRSACFACACDNAISGNSGCIQTSEAANAVAVAGSQGFGRVCGGGGLLDERLVDAHVNHLCIQAMCVHMHSINMYRNRRYACGEAHRRPSQLYINHLVLKHAAKGLLCCQNEIPPVPQRHLAPSLCVCVCVCM